MKRLILFKIHHLGEIAPFVESYRGVENRLKPIFRTTPASSFGTVRASAEGHGDVFELGEDRCRIFTTI